MKIDYLVVWRAGDDTKCWRWLVSYEGTLEGADGFVQCNGISDVLHHLICRLPRLEKKDQVDVVLDALRERSALNECFSEEALRLAVATALEAAKAAE